MAKHSNNKSKQHDVKSSHNDVPCSDYEYNSDNIFGHKKEGFKISNLDIQHLMPKIDELKVSFSRLKDSEKPYVIGFCETFLDSNICQDTPNELNIKGYTFKNARKDRRNKKKKGGGGRLDCLFC